MNRWRRRFHPTWGEEKAEVAEAKPEGWSRTFRSTKTRSTAEIFLAHDHTGSSSRSLPYMWKSKWLNEVVKEYEVLNAPATDSKLGLPKAWLYTL